MNKIKEAIKTNNGKLVYVCQLENEDGGKLQLFYSDYSKKIQFESNEFSFDRYNIFELNSESHKIAKEIFLTHLQTEVKEKLLELKQLELVLDELGLKEVIRKTIIDNSSMLLDTKEKIINESIENTNRLIDERVRPIARKKSRAGDNNDNK